MAKILIVDDEPDAVELVAFNLKNAGFEVATAADGAAALKQARAVLPDLIVLDRMLPEVDGLEVCKLLRRDAATAGIPIIMLTAKSDTEDEVRGLNAGADDYMPKPFEFAELLARLNAVVRRTSVRPTPVLNVNDLSLDLSTRRVSRNGRDVDLTPIEFSLLELLMRYAGQVVTRKMLCEHVWGFNWDGTTNVIEVHVNRLRGKLDQGRDDSIIKTIRGRGYSVNADETAPK